MKQEEVKQEEVRTDMNTKDIIKYLAIGGAVYFVYRYLSQHWGAMAAIAAGETSSDKPGVTTAPTSPTTGSTTITVKPPPTPPPAIPVASAPPTFNWPTGDALYTLLATDESAARAYPNAVTFNFDEWNYYRSLGGKPVIDALLVQGITGANRSSLVFTPAGYWDALWKTAMLNSSAEALLNLHDTSEMHPLSTLMGMGMGMGMGTVAPQYRWLM